MHLMQAQCVVAQILGFQFRVLQLALELSLSEGDNPTKAS